MVCDNNKNFDNQIKGESVDSILKSILQHRRIRFDNLRKEKPDLSNDEIELIIKKRAFLFQRREFVSQISYAIIVSSRKFNHGRKRILL